MNLYKIPAWALFLLLSAVLTYLPLRFLFRQNSEDSAKVLVEHEVASLGDESNLRVLEFSEKFRELRVSLCEMATACRSKATDGRLLTTRALSNNLDWKRDCAKLYEEFRQAAAGNRSNGDEPGGSRILHEALGECWIFSFEADGPQPIAVLTGEGLVSGPVPALSPCMKDWLGRAKEGRFSVASIGIEKVGERKAAHVAFGWRDAPRAGEPTLGVVQIVDVRRCIGNLDQISPRSLYFVVDSNWNLFYEPFGFDYKNFADLKLIPGSNGWPPHGIHPNQPITEEQDRYLRTHSGIGLNKRTDQRGVVAWSAPSDMRNLRYWLVKGRLPQDIPLEARTRVFRFLQAKRHADPGFCTTEPGTSSFMLILSHPSAALLAERKAMVSDEFKAAGVEPPTWDEPMECGQFIANITPLRLSQETDAPDQRLYFITAAAVEEIEGEIMDVYYSTRTRARLAMLAVLGLLSGLLYFIISWPLGKVSQAAKSLQKGEYDIALPRGYTSEVALLSGSFGAMRDQLRGRIREIREQGDLHKTVLETASEGIIGFTMKPDFADCTIDTANPAAERMFGYREGALEGKKLVELMELDDVRRALPGEDETESVHLNGLLRRISKGPPRWGKRRDGTQFRLEVGFSAVPALRLFVLVLRDVTQRLRDEEEISKKTKLLEQGKAELEDKVRERTGELEVALVRATDAMRAKDEFISSTSHELRQPLNTIIGYTEVLIEDAEGADPALGKDLTKIHGAAKHLLDLINDILDMAKIAAGKMELAYADFPVGDIAKDIENLAAPLAAKNGNKFVISLAEPARPMRSDMKRVKQVMLNLLSNACKFTKDGKVEFRVEPLGTDTMRFMVADTGLGMTPDQVSRLFQKFYQVDSSLARKTTGTGLGLAITRSLVDLLCGEVTVRSEPGKGSVFIVDIPVDCEAEAKRRAAAAPPTI